VCGLTLGLLCTITFGAMAALATVALAAGLLARRLRVEQRRRAYICLAVGAAIWLAAMVVLHLLCDRKLPLIFTQAMAAHRHLTWAGFHRRYAVWVVLNLVEFACFLGLPTLVAVFAGVGRTARRGLSAMGRADLIGLAGLLVLLVLNLSGGVRGEVGRVWMFMMPPLVLVAGAWLSAAPHRKRELALLTAALTLGQLLLLGWALTPIVRPY